MITEALYRLLAADPAVRDLVGDRIYPIVAPRSAAGLTHATYQRVAQRENQAHGQASGLSIARFQVSCHARTYAAADELAARIRAALDGYTGAIAQTDIQHCWLDGVEDIPSIDPQNDEISAHGVALFFEMAFSEQL